MILTNETHILISDGFTVKTLIEQVIKYSKWTLY